MLNYKVTGGRPISGEVTPEGNKNSILKIIPACVLTKETVTLTNVPKSSSVRVMLKCFAQLGGKVTYLPNNTVKLNAAGIKTWKIDQELAKQERATLLFLGPLLARFGKGAINTSGGCKLGNRPLDAMFQGLEGLGVKVNKDEGYTVNVDKLKGNKIWLIEASVTGTENLVLAAVMAKGVTEIYNAACEPHTQDLCNFLVSIGAQIQGIGSNHLKITGVDSLTGGNWEIISDHIIIGGLIVAAAITGGELTIRKAIPEHMTQVLQYFAKVNLKVKIDGENIIVPANQKLTCHRNFKGDIDKIIDWAWPSFPVDLIPQALVLANAGDGNMRIYSNMFETQLMFMEEFKTLGGDAVMANPHMVMTFGPAKYKAGKVKAPEVIQTAFALLLMMLAAPGTSHLMQADNLSRRYPTLIPMFQSLGAQIERV